MTADELRNLPKGMFIVMKTGFHPMKVKMKLFFKWGITFDEDNPYITIEHASRKVEYSCRDDIKRAIRERYPKEEPSIEPEETKAGSKTVGEQHVPRGPVPPTEFHTKPSSDHVASYMTKSRGQA